MASGDLPYRELKSGGGRRILKSDLDALLLDPRQEPEETP
jgi:hypothetical protein